MHHYSVTKLCFIIFCYLCSTSALCQNQDNLSFQHFTSENGLSENFVYTTYQDKKGFLWIGTHDGLNRYDGYNFKKFRHSPGDSTSLPDNTIYSICEDEEGILWMGTNAGLCKYNPSTGIFSPVMLQNKLNGVQQLTFLDKEELLLWNATRLCVINTRTQKEIPLNYKDSSGLYPVSYSRHPVSKDQQGNIYIIKPTEGDAVIFRYDRQNKYFSKFVTLAIPGKSTLYSAGFFYIDSRNYCWLAIGDSALHVFNLSSPNLQIDQPEEPARILTTNATKHIFEDNERNIWVASSSGLIYNDRVSNKTAWYKQDNKNSSSISSDDVQNIFQDRTGIIWIATSNGLNKLNPLQKKFSHLIKTENSNAGLYNNFILGVYPEGKNQVRIHYHIYENPHFTRYNIHNQNFRHIAFAGYDAASWIREVMVKNPERLTNELLQTLNILYEKKRALLLRGVAEIWIDERQQFWVNQFRTLSHLNQMQVCLRDTFIETMQLYGNDMWIASPKGLIQFNTISKKSIVHNVDAARSNSISSNDITCFVFEQNGNMWIGTKGGGLNFFDRQKNSFTHLLEKDGLCNNSIYCMVKDDNGKLWIGTSFGLSRFDPATQKFQNYFRADGLINNEYNRYSACKMPDGTIFMGGMNGIDFFHPDSLAGNKSKPQVLVTDFKVFNQSIYPGKIPLLEYDQNFIHIEFAAMDFTNPAANKFAYKLQNVDKDWVMCEGRNFTTYSYLPPGQYHFLIKAANSDGIWNEESAICDFTILPAWYQTWWFISLVVLAFAALIYSLFRYRLQQQLRVLQVRNRLHRDLHDDIGATLSSVKAYSEILRDNPNNSVIAELIKDNSTDMLDRLEVIAWATNPQHDNFKSLKNTMIKFATPICHSKNIRFHLESNGINDEMLIPGEVRQNIFLVFKESITNMAKYAEAKECNAQLFVQNNQFKLQITDDGKGFDGAIKGTGNGWKNMQKRAEDLNGNLSIESKPGNGTTITMQVPYPFKIPSSWDRNKV